MAKSKPKPKHSHKYTGLTAPRTSCPICQAIWTSTQAQNLPQKAADLKARITKGKARLKSIGEEFKDTSADHWRWLLFEKLGLKPIAYTGKRRTPQLNDEVLEKLIKKHPSIDLLQSLGEIKKLDYQLSNALSWEPDRDGRVRFIYSQRTSTGRVQSGSDLEEEGKNRDSRGGNAQNPTDRDRQLFVAPPDHYLLNADYSQIEARVTAWLAGETRMLQAWVDGLDIHALNGITLAQALGRKDVTLDNVDSETLKFGGTYVTYRYAAKRMTHGWNYGMGADKTARMYGIPILVASRMIEAYFESWPQLKEFHHRLLEDVEVARYYRNNFGRRIKFYGFEWSEEDQRWVLKNREKALAAPGQSNVGDMIKTVLWPAEGLEAGRLITTTHDSLTFEVKEGVVEKLAKQVLETMQRPWPQLGQLPKFGTFICPSDISVGKNWGKYHEHTGKCQQPCPKVVNPFGLKGFRPA